MKMGRGSSHSSAKSGGGGVSKSTKKKLEEEEAKVVEQLSQEDLGMLAAYSDDGYGPINEFLYGAASEIDHDLVEYYDEDQIIAGIDRTIASFNQPMNMTVNRTSDSWIVGTSSVDKINAMKGQVITNKAYTSTSIGDNGAFKNKGNIDYVINVPKGKGRGAYVGSKIGMHQYESEYVLKRNTRFRIDGASYRNGRKVVQLTVLD